MARTYDWDFPLPRTHTGILQGNGVMGVMIWGEGGVLRLTLGRADFWDHRGGMPWTAKMSYANIRACLERNDEKGLRELFERTQNAAGEPARPSVIPVGRVELDFGPKARLVRGTLDVDTGLVTVQLRAGGQRREIQLALDMHAPALVVQTAGLPPVAIRAVPASETLAKAFAAITLPPAEPLPAGAVGGWVQRLPADPPLCVAWRQQGDVLCLATARAATPAAALAAASTDLTAAADRGLAGTQARNVEWWSSYWADVPKVNLPNERLAFLYYYGMYKFAGLTHPAGVAATLQGPWIEEYQMPPWSSDYHFNINVQLCYQPAYHGNRLVHLRPLWDLIAGWQDTLRHNARVFLGRDDGVMLPHAVDDRCMCMGGFWTGSVDHGCTAWVALMMFRYYRYTMDAAFLRATAWPFMRGAMRVYEGMLERDGEKLVLPVSVSPEYRGAAMNAWGRNASFQLACVHALAEALQAAAAALGETPDPAWADILARLPKACTIKGWGGADEIALWDGTPLEESHRHHSHLAGITPFDIYDFDDTATRELLERSISRWIFRGPGLWSGWCVPWAAMIHTRFGNADMAESLLENLYRFFTNVGHGTLHDADVPGWTLMGIGATRKRQSRAEIMQMDAGMAAVAAVQEMLLHTRRGVNYLFAGAPRTWQDVAFGPMRTDGGFLVSARRRRGVVGAVTVVSPYGGEFRLANPWGDRRVRVQRATGRTSLAGAVLGIPTTAGDTLTLRPGA